MGRKKKEEAKEFTPSKYQSDIFDFIEHGNGNLVIEAAAGSGKTSTIIRSLSLIPSNKRILFCAFNKDIVKELETKIKDAPNVDIRTVHSLGLLMLTRNLDNFKPFINENKYRGYITQNAKYYTQVDLYTMGKVNYYKYIDNICRLVEYCRFNLADSEREAFELSERHGMDLLADECTSALHFLEWGKNNLREIDYTDMVWLPNVLNHKPIGLQFDFVFGDEAQDFSVAQRELLLKCRKMGTRYVFCGDRNQCIYSFASASPDSFDKLKELPNTTVLPLSISYRCSKNIVDLAKHIVPTIEPNEDGRDGEILQNVTLEDVKDGDMILCRNNAPLMKAYNEFIRMDKKCFIRGKEIGTNLKKIVESMDCDKLYLDLSQDGLFARLYSKFFSDRNAYAIKSGLDKKSALNTTVMEGKLDIIRALEFLAEGLTTTEQLLDKIKTVFSDKKSGGIFLSTIHKAKGLEANNVYIACRSLMPSKSARQDWEKEQEKNLIYVAYTRAKNKLGFIDEHILSSKSVDTESIDEIEKHLGLVLGKDFGNLKKGKKEYTPKAIFSGLTPIETSANTATVVLGNGMKLTTNKNKLSELTKRRTFKKK
jgi:superfamily I DNA/RNA helicase